MAQPDDLNAWLGMAVRMAELSFIDGNAVDAAKLKANGITKPTGVRVTWAFRQMERVAGDLLDRLETKAHGFNASRPQVATARVTLLEFLGKLARQVRGIAAHVAPDSPAVQDATNRLIEALTDEVDAVLASCERRAVPDKPANGKLKARPGPKVDNDWRDKVYKFCKAAGRDYVANPDLGGRVFLSEVKAWYQLKFEDAPRDYRRTQEHRQAWLDAQAGLTG